MIVMSKNILQITIGILKVDSKTEFTVNECKIYIKILHCLFSQQILLIKRNCYKNN